MRKLRESKSSRKKHGAEVGVSLEPEFRTTALMFAQTLGPNDFISGPKLRARFGISPVTLWRWRHARQCGFPKPKVINGRLYFSIGAVSDWLAKQPEAA